MNRPFSTQSARDRFGAPVLDLSSAKVRKARNSAPTTQRNRKGDAALEHLAYLVGEIARGRDINRR